MTHLHPAFRKNKSQPVSYTHLDVYKRQVLDSDPIRPNWQMNESTRDYVAKFGFKQNTSADCKTKEGI